MARGNNRQRVFREEKDHLCYLRLLNTALTDHKIQLHHYCLMPNHIHLLVGSALPQTLGSLMHEVQRRYWFHVRKNYVISGHLWQGRYHSFPIEEESYLLECGRYIERNPMAAELTADLTAYPWTSYPFYSKGQEVGISLVAHSSYQALGSTAEVRQRAWGEYVLTNRPYDQAVHQRIQEVAVGV